MQQVVSYSYERPQSARPTLYDQVEACRAYAQAQGYRIVGEYNDVETPTHPNQGAGVAALLEALADDPSTAVLIYQPDQDVLDRLQAKSATVEAVPAIAQRAARA
jgi:hypothetical protein